MKLYQLETSYLYEELLLRESKSLVLWESAGQAIVEAQLTPQQITQLFQQVEQGATAAGGNRTLVGQGKDVATAVKAAYDDLVSKVQNSGPVQNIDALYDQAAAKLKAATGGDQGVMQYVEKYRAFAKAHPIAQSLIYSALIAAAGISGAGAGGAAALGLLKMTDKLLQGEKFSTAVGKGAATGAVAYGAGQVGQALSGDEAETTRTVTQQTSTGMQPTWPTAGVVPPGVLSHFPPEQFQYMQAGDYWEVFDQAGNKVANFDLSQQPLMRESVALTVTQIARVFSKVNRLDEGLWDSVKTAVANKAQQVGKNLTTKVTADKLMSAWRSAGKPTDSVQLADFLKQQGVPDAVIVSVFKQMKIPMQAPAAAPKMSVREIKAVISKMRGRDLLSLQKTVNSIIAKKTRTP